MTFIASVVARNGVAIIADSLVTTTSPIIEYPTFIDFIDKKVKETKEGSIKLEPKEISNLFINKPHHTKNFEEKLFKYDEYTAITTAGSALINDKNILKIIEEIKSKNKTDGGYSRKKIETKVKDFCNYLTKEIKQHLKEKTLIKEATFLITHYNHKSNKTTIFEVIMLPSSQRNLEDEKYKFVQNKKREEYEKVVCGGQYRISQRILFGAFPAITETLPIIFKKIVKDFSINSRKIPSDYIKQIVEEEGIIPYTIWTDMKMFRLDDLSLQQSVDLASLLMRVEMDFQNYTEDIPTVGGVIKLAVIDKEKFRFVTGHEINKPYVG